MCDRGEKELGTVTTEAHLMASHGFNAWTYDQFRHHYREYVLGPGRFDFDGLHARDHRRNQDELDHPYWEVMPNEQR